MTTVSLVNVSKVYDKQVILDKINLNIEQGEFVAVIGPSGCGKSTLLRLVSGLETVTNGNILINNQCVNTIPPAQRDMAMVFQNYALYPHMTVFDNIAYGLKIRGMKKSAIQKKVHEVALLLQLSDYLQRKPQALSGGQRQRVAMGRAMVRSPAVFLFDEPLSNLDAKLRTEMRHEIRKLHQQLQTTCLYVTHDQTEAMTMADRVLVLNQGQVEQIATPQELYQRPHSLFVAGFTGLYPMNFLPATVDLMQQKVVTHIGLEFNLPSMQTSLVSGQRVIIGIRPEHLVFCISKQSETIPVRIDFIDELGADKLVKATSRCGRAEFLVRTILDVDVNKEQLALELVINKANLFDETTGLRLGGWNG